MAQPNALVPAERDTALAYVLWFGGFFGVCGLHQIYMGRYASGLLWFFTGGLCFVGQFIERTAPTSVRGRQGGPSRKSATVAACRGSIR